MSMPLTFEQMDEKIDAQFAYEGHDDVEIVLATLDPTRLKQQHECAPILPAGK